MSEAGTRQRRRRFSLTPFADALFQLLTFFILTTNLTAYSVLGLQPGGAPERDDRGTLTAGSGGRSAGVPSVLWTLENGIIQIRGQEYPMEDLPALVSGQVADVDRLNVIVLVRASARVQDLVAVLEAWAATPVASIEISLDGGA